MDNLIQVILIRDSSCAVYTDADPDKMCVHKLKALNQDVALFDVAQNGCARPEVFNLTEI